nr:hypothetical protein [Nocardia crassostreae]
MPAAYSLLLALLVLGPLLGSGYLLLRDAVSTPRSYLTDSALGLGDAAPRAVPQDAMIAVLSTVVDGGLIVKAILLAAIWLSGWGAAVLARELLHATLAPQLVAATVAIWNPYVAERLLQGHWSLLTGYAALPWIAVLATRLRGATRSDRTESRTRATPPGGERSSSKGRFASSTTAPRALTWVALGGCLAAAGLTPTGSLLAACVALLLVGRRNLIGTLALWIVASAPWLVATALSGGGAAPSDPAGVAAFAARAEPWLGTLGSLAGLGGIWNSTAVPDSRTTFFAFVGTVVLLGLVATGVRAVAGSTGGAVRPGGNGIERSARRRLLSLAGVTIALPALGATEWGLAMGEFLVQSVPGAGLLRDTQKFVALAVPAYALCAAAGCLAVAQWIAAARARNAAAAEVDSPEHGAGSGAAGSGRARIGGVAAGFIVLVLVALPDMAWGVGGALRPVHYPAGWERVAGRVDGPGDVAVLPGGMFRKFSWAGAAPVLDPAPRMLPRDVLQTGELPVRGATVSGEGTRAREVERVLLRGGSGAELGELGVGWVLVEGGTPGPMGESKATLAQLTSVYSDPDVQLYRVRSDYFAADGFPGARRISGAAHLLWAALLIAGMLAAVRSVFGEAEPESDGDHDGAHHGDHRNDPHD